MRKSYKNRCVITKSYKGGGTGPFWEESCKGRYVYVKFRGDVYKKELVGGIL